MADLKTKVVILEDDAAFAAALVSYLGKLGVEALPTSKAAQARDFLLKFQVSALIVDCLLPGESGIDFVKSIRPKYSKDVLDIILISGVFTDAGFVKESLRDTQAVGFLKKPFSLDELKNYLRLPTVAPEAVHPRKNLYATFFKRSVSVRDKMRAIEALEEIHAFDLPLIYSLLFSARASGHLNIVSHAGEVSGVTFSKGLICGVDIADQDTYLGKLLIEAGFILPEDLEQVLKIQSSQRIGERLIQNNLLSPHGFAQAMSNQMSLRISKMIADTEVKVNFVDSDVTTPPTHIGEKVFGDYLHDWIAGKISANWLKNHYLQWGNARILPTEKFKQDPDFWKRPLVEKIEGLREMLTQSPAVTDFLESQRAPEEALLKCLHFLLVSGVVSLDEATQISKSDRLTLLRKMAQQFHGKNQMEIYDLVVKMTSLNGRQVDQVKREFARILGEDKGRPEEELYSLRLKIETEVNRAFRFASSGDHDKIREEMQKAEVASRLKASAALDEAKVAMLRSQYREGLEKIKIATALDSSMEKAHLLTAWGLLGTFDMQKNKDAQIKEIEMNILQVAPEEKYDAVYSFVCGLVAKVKGDVSTSKKLFEKALALDPTMVVARREVAALSAGQGPKQDILNADLKTLVGSLFKKK